MGNFHEVKSVRQQFLQWQTLVSFDVVLVPSNLLNWYLCLQVYSRRNEKVRCWKKRKRMVSTNNSVIYSIFLFHKSPQRDVPLSLPCVMSNTAHVPAQINGTDDKTVSASNIKGQCAGNKPNTLSQPIGRETIHLCNSHYVCYPLLDNTELTDLY